MDFEIDRDYPFVRNDGDRIERAEFTRFDDGSAIVKFDGHATIWENVEDAWELALSDLRGRGFVIESGLAGSGTGTPGGPAA